MNLARKWGKKSIRELKVRMQIGALKLKTTKIRQSKSEPKERKILVILNTKPMEKLKYNLPTNLNLVPSALFTFEKINQVKIKMLMGNW